MTWLKKLKPVLTPNQLERLANIFDNAGQVVFGVVVLSPIIGGAGRTNLFVVFSGIISMSICWVTSVLLSRRAENL